MATPILFIAVPSTPPTTPSTPSTHVDLEKILRIHTEFPSSRSFAYLVVGLLRYVSSRTWDDTRVGGVLYKIVIFWT